MTSRPQSSTNEPRSHTLVCVLKLTDHSLAVVGYGVIICKVNMRRLRKPLSTDWNAIVGKLTIDNTHAINESSRRMDWRTGETVTVG